VVLKPSGRRFASLLWGAGSEPYQSDKSDPHQNEKGDPEQDLQQSDADPQHC
jgi:hypothetical protein